jgi:DNA end-binding protein Ku
VDAAAVAPYFYEAPYYLEPGKRGEKGYTLLREVLKRTGRIAIANVVIRSRQHLAAVIPVDRVLLLNTLRWANEIRSMADLTLPDAGMGGLTEKELAMAERLVEDMADEWKPEQYKDTYTDDLMARIEQRIKAGQTHVITAETEEAGEPRRGAQVIDLVSMLRRSLEQTGKAANDDGAEAGKERSRRAAARKTPSRLAGKKTPAQQRKRA